MSSSSTTSGSGDDQRDDEEEEEEGGGGGRRVVESAEATEPSSSRQRSANGGDWPELFIESLAYQVAIDAVTSAHRTSAAPALSNLFQVCTTWRSVSQSRLLWQNLTRRIWRVESLTRGSWRDEFIYRHHMSLNFRRRRSVYTTLEFDDSSYRHGLMCCCLALSDFHLACGFIDGSVRIFELPRRVHVRTFFPQDRDRLGPLSRSVTGFVLTRYQIVFASMDGDVHVADLYGHEEARRAHLGNVLNDGTLVDFSGCTRWWIGLYAGVPGCSFRIWDGTTEAVLYFRGTFTDPEAVLGWRLLKEYLYPIGRVRVSTSSTDQQIAVACTGVRIISFDLRDPDVLLNDEEVPEGAVVATFDGNYNFFMLSNNSQLATVRAMDTFEVTCRFSTGSTNLGGVRIGCKNSEYAIMAYSGGVMRVWDVERGYRLYNIRERIRDITALTANNRHIAAYSADSGIHLWDHGTDHPDPSEA